MAELKDKESWAAEGSSSDITAATPTRDSHPFHCSAAPHVLELTVKPWLCMANGEDQPPVRTRGPQTSLLSTLPHLLEPLSWDTAKDIKAKWSATTPLTRGLESFFQSEETLWSGTFSSAQGWEYLCRILISSFMGFADYLLFLVYRTSKAWLILNNVIETKTQIHL